MENVEQCQWPECEQPGQLVAALEIGGVPVRVVRCDEHEQQIAVDEA